MTYWKLLRIFFAFVSEVILGKSTLAQAYRYDRRRIYVLAIVLISLSLNFLTVPRLVSLSYEHYLLRREYHEYLGSEQTNSWKAPLPEPTAIPIDLSGN